MSYISTENSIKCTTVRYMSEDEEKEIRDNTRYHASEIAQGRDLNKKIYLPYRLVNGMPLPGTNHRSNETLQDSGLCLLDFDIKDSRENHYMNVWKLLKPHLNDWHIVHFEQSLRSGCHATVRVPEGLSRKQTIRLFELRTGLKIDSCHDRARACFLVPNEYVIHTTPEYYFSEPLAPVPLTDEDKLMIEKDEEETRKKREAAVAKYQLKIQTDGLPILEEIAHICDLIDEIKHDLTATYDRYLRLGLMLATELGEQGRPFFHRLSQHHPEYNPVETDKRYTEHLKNTRGEIHVGSLFYWLKEDFVLQ